MLLCTGACWGVDDECRHEGRRSDQPCPAERAADAVSLRGTRPASWSRPAAAFGAISEAPDNAAPTCTGMQFSQ